MTRKPMKPERLSERLQHLSEDELMTREQAVSTLNAVTEAAEFSLFPDNVSCRKFGAAVSSALSNVTEEEDPFTAFLEGFNEVRKKYERSKKS